MPHTCKSTTAGREKRRRSLTVSVNARTQIFRQGYRQVERWDGTWVKTETNRQSTCAGKTPRRHPDFNYLCEAPHHERHTFWRSHWHSNFLSRLSLDLIVLVNYYKSWERATKWQRQWQAEMGQWLCGMETGRKDRKQWRTIRDFGAGDPISSLPLRAPTLTTARTFRTFTR